MGTTVTDFLFKIEKQENSIRIAPVLFLPINYVTKVVFRGSLPSTGAIIKNNR